MAATSPLIGRKKNKVKMKILDLLPKVGSQIWDPRQDQTRCQKVETRNK